MKFSFILALFILGAACSAPTAPVNAQPGERTWGRLEYFGPPRSAVQPPQANPLVDSLVAYYGLEESSGTRYDGHGTNHLTAYNNPGDTVGVIGQAAKFDNTLGQYLQTSSPNMAVMQGDWTVMFWAKVGNADATLKMAISRGSYYSCPNAEYVVYYQSGAYVTRVCNGSTNQVSSTAYAGQWRHYVVSYNSSVDSVHIYDNSSSANKISVTGNIVNIGPFTIGATGSGSYTYLGCIDEVYFWRGYRVSPTFITWYYNSGAGRTYSQITSYLP